MGTSTLDEALHFAEHSDYSTDEVAGAVGVTAEAVRRSLRRAGRSDVLSRLEARQERPAHVRHGRIRALGG